MRVVWLVLTAGFRRQWRSWVLLGAVGGIVVAALLSPLAPLGEARLAEPAPGPYFDAAVLGLGALATVVVVMTLGLLPALRAARTRGAAERMPAARPSLIAGGAATAGAPPGAVIGIRHALERGRGTRAVPVGTALVGSVAGVAALCATAVFGSSLAHLTVTPALYGAPFQDYFNIGTGAAMTTAGYASLLCPPSSGQARCRTAVAQSAELALVRAVPGPEGTAALARHAARHPDDVTPPAVPAALVNFGAAAAFPLLLGGVVAMCGLAALAHLLVVSVARRRAESGLLMALGMIRRQLAAIGQLLRTE